MQGSAGLLWWVSLHVSPRVRSWFVAEDGWPVARSLVIADVIGFAMASIVVGFGLLRERPWAGPAALAVCAITAYAALIAAMWTVAPVDRVLPLLAMVAALVGTAAATAVANRS